MPYTNSPSDTTPITNGKLTPELFQAAGIPVTDTAAATPVDTNPDKAIAKPFKQDGGTNTAAVVPAAKTQPVRCGVRELDQLARRIRESRKAAQKAGVTALHHILDAGDALNAAQAQVSTGWKRWLRDNCSLSVRTALLYQQLANHREEIEAEISQAGELSLRSARRLISKSKQEDGEEGPEEEEETGALENPVPEEPNLEAPPNPVAIWNTFSATDKTAILDSEGRAGLATLASPTLLGELVDHAIGQQINMAPASNAKLQVTLTQLLINAVYADTPEAMSAAFAAFRRKCRANHLDPRDAYVGFRKKRRR
jgi:hypothetical protein